MYIDNLNLTYVAFTRAKHEMYAFGAVAKEKKDGYTIRNIGNLIYSFYRNQLDEDNTLLIGERKHYEAPAATDANTMLNHYVYSPAFPRLQLRRHQSEKTLTGSRMHNLLSRMRVWDDQPEAIAAMLSEGILRNEQVPETQRMMEHFRQLCKDYTWFDSNERVLMEEDIITPSGETFRPDRVIINGQHATVIDYKFGQEKHIAAYSRQVQHYMSLLGQMGYHADGYIVYAALNRIEPVQPQTSIPL